MRWEQIFNIVTLNSYVSKIPNEISNLPEIKKNKITS